MVNNKGICKLCGKTSDIQLSHIIPAFVVKYQKSTSITGYIRNSKEPNLRQQDGEKYRLFCSNCEAIFSNVEKYFSETVFMPYHSGLLHTLNYDYRLGRFCACQALRKIIYNEAISEGANSFSSTLLKSLQKATKFLKDYVISEAKSQNEYANHLIFMDLIDNAMMDSHSLPDNINMYLTRTMDTAIVSSRSGKLFIYNKLCKIIILTFVVPKKPKYFEGTRVFGTGSITMSKRDIVLPFNFLRFLIDRANIHNEIKGKISDKQMAAIEKDFFANEDRVVGSEDTKAFLADERLRALGQL